MFAIYLWQSLILCIDSLQPLVYYRLNSAVLVYTLLIISICCIYMLGGVHKNHGVMTPLGVWINPWSGVCPTFVGLCPPRTALHGLNWKSTNRLFVPKLLFKIQTAINFNATGLVWRNWQKMWNNASLVNYENNIFKIY